MGGLRCCEWSFVSLGQQQVTLESFLLFRKDLSAENVLVAEGASAHVKVIDYGAASTERFLHGVTGKPSYQGRIVMSEPTDMLFGAMQSSLLARGTKALLKLAKRCRHRVGVATTSSVSTPSKAMNEDRFIELEETITSLHPPSCLVEGMSILGGRASSCWCSNGGLEHKGNF
eukprot:5414009-Amphidinium_carterae.1